MNPRVTNVQALENYSLALEFDNGERGIFSMLPYLKYPVYQRLEDQSFFRKARVAMGIVSWDEDTDMSPDTLYLDSKIIA